MPTTVTPLTPNAWTLAYTGPTDSEISVERGNRSPTIFLAVSASEPEFTASGHYLQEGKIKGVELEAGENLYAWCATGQQAVPSTDLIITD
jgi:hypothetical protein